MEKSLWTATSKNTKKKKLENDLDLDVLIIGGGITGLSICYNLINTNKKIALVEANEIASGVTSKTTGKITYLQGNYHDIYKKYGFYTTKKYYESQLIARDLLVKIIKDNNIKCDLEESTSYLYAKEEDKIRKLKEEFAVLEKIGCKDIKKEKKLPDGKKYPYILRGSHSYVFHPLKYLYALKKTINKKQNCIYENTRVLDIKKMDGYYLCKTTNNIIKSKVIVLATHYPYFIFPYLMPLKVTLEKSYVGAKKNENLHFDALSIDKECTSIRFLTDKSNSFKIFIYGSYNLSFNTNIEKNFSKLKSNMQESEFYWSNIDILTGDYMPFMGEIDNNMYLATGYNTWGMTNGTLAGKVITDLILTNDSPYKKLFNPNRKIYSNWLKALGSNTKSYITEGLFYKKSWYNGKIIFATKNGKDIAIYTDQEGKKHSVYRKCPHFKCSLLFNEQELTWDCPCHGSRFDIDGNVIEGPSNYNISVE